MNRYIKAMEIGLANEENGISYFDLVYELHGSKEKCFSEGAEITFYSWFKNNFELGTVDHELFSGTSKGQFQDFLRMIMMVNIILMVITLNFIGY